VTLYTNMIINLTYSLIHLLIQATRNHKKITKLHKREHMHKKHTQVQSKLKYI